MLWLGSFAGVVILLIGLGLWRLLQGPIELDRLTPYVEAALNRSAGGLHVAISGVRFGIDRATRQFDLAVEGVRLARPDGEPIAAFPEMSASFSMAAALRGRLMPTRLVVERPVLRIVRNEAGRFKLRLSGEGGDTQWLAPDFFETAADPAKPDAPLGQLRRVVVHDATLVLDDRQSGRRWHADRVDATLTRNPAGFDGDLSMALPLAGSAPELHASYRYAAADRTLDLALDVGALDPSALKSLSPELAPLDALHFPVSGTLEARFDLAALQPQGARVDLAFGQGAIKDTMLAHGELDFHGGEAHLVYTPETHQLRLARLTLDLGGGARLACDGSIDGIDPRLLAGGGAPPLSARLGVTLTNLAVARLDGLWPPSLSRGGRRWVLANIHDGVLDEGSFDFGLRLDPATSAADLVSVKGAMRYHDLTVDYFRDLPPLKKAGGTATVTGKELDFTPNAGMIKGVQITGGTVQITGLDGPNQWLTTDVAVAGPIRDALEIIDAKSLHFAHDVGLDPARVVGQMETHLHFRLPLIDALQLDDVEYGVKANLSGAGIDQIVLGRGISDGNFALEVTRPGLHLQGNARFDQTPAAIDANFFFKPKDGLRGRYKIGLTLDDAARQRLGIADMPDRLKGPVGVDLTYAALAGNRAEAQAALDFAAAQVTVAEAGWTKPPGMPATARIAATLVNDRLGALREIAVKAAGLDGRFAVAFGDGGQIDRVDFQHLAIADDDIAGTVARRREGGWHVDLRGARLDLAPWLKDTGKSSTEGPPLQIEARLARLLLGPRREVRDVSAQLTREGGYWQTATIDAHFPNGRHLALRLGIAGGKRGLDFTSDDLGATLSLLDITDNVVGGQVRVTGQVTDAGDKRTLRGHIEGENYSLVRAPVTARVLSLASLTGPSAMLADKGIPFTSLRGEFSYSEGRLVIDELLAYGGALGATANGTVDLAREQLDLQGTIVPAYTINSVLGNVPVIGNLLLGGEGQGLFAANYRVTGAESDPQISVNPLSALAPGFLRRLMQPNFGLPKAVGDKPSVDFPSAPVAPAPQQPQAAAPPVAAAPAPQKPEIDYPAPPLK